MLTPADRARLRPTVDVEAFERFLAALLEDDRPGVQRAAVLHFAREVTVADVRDFLIAVGNDEAAADVARALTAAEAERHSEEAVSHRPTSPAAQFFSMERPESPRLAALWDAIEPSPPASG